MMAAGAANAMGKRDKLSDEAIEAFLGAHPGWSREAGGPSALARTFSFQDYAAGIAFVVRLGFAAEANDHHPDLYVGWRRVRVVWSTHDAGGITALDADMAERTDTLAG
jgi:4a-hydroxytetrahydrobiopterin dehydratase